MDFEAETASLVRIERTRRIGRKAATMCGQHGVTTEELAIAGLYTAFELASDHAGPGIAAVEWLRLGADMLERHIMERQA